MKAEKRPCTRMEHKRAKRVLALCTTLVVAITSMAVVAVTGAFTEPTKVEQAQTPAPEPKPVETPEKAVEEVETYEVPEYFVSGIALDVETQGLLWAACEETGVPYALALAVIRQETTFRNITGDNGDSIGYMQIQPKWHKERMAKLGVTDLSDPLSNFRVGCDFLAELMNKYLPEEALTAYNSGSPGKSDYATSVLNHMEDFR